jgi:hypothetical protein
MKTLFFSIVLCLAVAPAFGQTSELNPAYKIRAQRGGLTVTFQGKRHWLNVAEHIDAAKIKSTQVLFANQKEGFRFLVIEVSGDSRDGNYDRQCGAGTEANLLWLKLDAEWKILDLKAVRYQSCWSGVDLNGPFKITKTALTMEYSNSREDINSKLSYNADEPEKGFQIEETAIKDQ